MKNSIYYVLPGHAIIGTRKLEDHDLYAMHVYSSPKQRKAGTIPNLTVRDTKELEHAYSIAFKDADHVQSYINALIKLRDKITEDTQAKDYPIQ